MTVWLLYTGDHMLDAWKHRKNSQREMHRFIFRKKGILIYILGVITVADLLVIFNFLDPAMLESCPAPGRPGISLLCHAPYLQEQQAAFYPG